MKVLIGVTGIGLGHATRVHALLPYLKSYKILAAEPAYSYFLAHGIKATNIKGIEYKGKEFSFSMLKTAIEELRKRKEIKRSYTRVKNLIDSYNPDVILSDSEPLTIMAGLKFKKRVITLTNLPTILTEIEYIPKVYLNAKLKAQYKIIKWLINYLVKRNVEVVCPSFVKYKKRNITFINPIIRTLEKKPRKGNFYLVNFGGSVFGNALLKEVIPYLKAHHNKKFIVVSNYFTKRRTLKDNLTIVPFIKDMLFYVASSKGIISHAGHSTLSESICMKKPSLVIPLKNHIEQLANAISVFRTGLAHASLDYEFKDDLKTFFKRIPELKFNLEEENVQPTGAKELADIIYSKY